MLSVPGAAELQIKKTSYKKLSVFLAEMEKEKILKLEKAGKGVEQIASVDFRNQFFRGLNEDLPENEEATEPEEKPMVEILGASSTKIGYRKK